MVKMNLTCSKSCSLCIAGCLSLFLFLYFLCKRSLHIRIMCMSWGQSVHSTRGAIYTSSPSAAPQEIPQSQGPALGAGLCQRRGCGWIIILTLWTTSSWEVCGGLVHEAVVAKAKMLWAMAKLVLTAAFALWLAQTALEVVTGYRVPQHLSTPSCCWFSFSSRRSN